MSETYKPVRRGRHRLTATIIVDEHIAAALDALRDALTGDERLQLAFDDAVDGMIARLVDDGRKIEKARLLARLKELESEARDEGGEP